MSSQSEYLNFPPQSFRPKLLVTGEKVKTNINMNHCRCKNSLSFIIDSL